MIADPGIDADRNAVIAASTAGPEQLKVADLK